MFRKRKENPKLELCTLSGTNEIGRNCSYVKYNNQVLVVDAGLSFPDQEMYGIDYLIPNVNHLKKKVKEVKGILITHGHLDHIGALPYILQDLHFPPVYAGPFAAALIREKLTEFGLEKKVKIIEIRGTSKFQLGDFNIWYIANTHSIPDSFSIYIQSPKGNVFFSGDYKMDDEETDIATLEQIKGKVDIALFESTNAYKEGKSMSESKVALTIEDIIKKHKGRVIVAAFASLVTRLASIVEIAKKTNKKILLSGRSLKTTVAIALQYGYIKANPELFVKEENISKVPNDDLIILTTGSQAERYAALNRISLGEHKYIKAKEGDLIIMSSSEIPGNAALIEKMTDRLIKLGVELIKSAEADVHSSGHGLQEDMRILYEILQPKYIIPVHGSLTFRYQNKKNYVSWGHNPDKVQLTEDGQTWLYDPNEGLKRGIKIESKPILIDGLGVGDIGEIVLKDRRQLAEFGMFCVILNLSQKTKHLLGKPRFISRGFVYLKNSQPLLKEIETICVDTHRQWLSRGKNQAQEETLIQELESNISRYIFKKTEREPIILPVII